MIKRYTQPLIRFYNICKGFKKKQVLTNINLNIYPQEIFGLVGKSGCGKTTLLRILMGFYNANFGKIIFQGEDITKKLYQIRKHVGFTTQENSFYKKLTIKENLYYYGRIYGVKRQILKNYVPQLLELVDLYEFKDTLTEKLSGGMKRRVDFAISLIHNPEIIILDEPTTGLDPILRKQIWRLIRTINRNGKTIIVTTHFFDEIVKNCHRIGILDNGKMKGVGTLAQFRGYSKKQSFEDIFEGIVGK